MTSQLDVNYFGDGSRTSLTSCSTGFEKKRGARLDRNQFRAVGMGAPDPDPLENINISVNYTYFRFR